MHVSVRGAGPALVLLHGWAMHGGVFDALAQRLQDHFTLHIVDLPGHGRSQDNTLPLAPAALADALLEQLPPATWIGWSLGGLVALAAAQRNPGAVHGLGMLCASPRFVRGEDWPEGMDPAIFDRFADDLAADYRTAVDRFILLETYGSDHAREEIRTLREIAFQHGEPSIARLCEGLKVLQDSDLRAGLSGLQMPSLWIAGRRDRLVTPAAMQRAATACGGEFLEVAHAGHAPFLTHGDVVAAAIVDAAGGWLGTRATHVAATRVDAARADVAP
ncbi:pimeloyl-ACP methyl ester esterase BioH [soil metagenome]